MRVLQLIDSLHAGGAERMAVSYANELVSHVEGSFLCATREEGLLKETINARVGFIFLKKKSSIDIMAFLKLLKFVKDRQITTLHAHSSSFFYASLLKTFRPNLKLIWHDHYGQNETLASRKFGVLKQCSRNFDAIISVNGNLQEWAKAKLRCKNVFYLKNFVSDNFQINSTTTLQGNDDFRIVCLANIREQKDHLNLLQAFKMLKESISSVSLHLIGEFKQNAYYKSLVTYIDENKLEQVYFYGSQNGVLELLRTSGLGVLSSRSEGLPVALLEYGVAGIAVVCTDVGQCRDVIKSYGKLVPRGDAKALSKAMLEYIENEARRQEDAELFSAHIRREYSFQAVLPKLLSLYKKGTY